MNKWKRKVQALIRLAEDQAGRPEGDTARRKLQEILDRHPEARDYEPVKEFTLKELGYMRRQGISTDGSWTGNSLEDAIKAMVADYRQRMKRTSIIELEPRKLQPSEIVYNFEDY